ncbi:MAG: 3-isopropylmalate dehydratase small subunit [Promethearchaeota archaeon]|jgi:3-isopropylmalate/(R)-2-methylmalate dehydratase small subunit
MIGKVIKYNLKDINTDLIIPARYLTSSNPDYLAHHCMEDLDAQFTEKIIKHKYSILVAGANFGCGSSREQAPIAIKAAGIKCIIATSFARIFFRNAINIGLPILEFNEVENLNTDDILEIILDTGIIKSKNTGMEYQVKKIPPFLQEIISAEGLINYTKKIINKIL